jgi:hypothetical protein
MIDLRKFAVPALFVISGSMLAGCGDSEPKAESTPAMTEDAMMEEEDAMVEEEDAMVEEDDDAMEDEDAMMEDEA